MAVSLLLLAMAPAAEAEYDLKSFTSHTTDVAGVPYTLAGGHPEQSVTEFTIRVPDGALSPEQNLNGTYVTLPTGAIANPTSARRCSIGRLAANGEAEDVSDCPAESRIGIARVTLAPLSTPATVTLPIYNLVPERGFPAQFGFVVFRSAPTAISVFPRSRNDSYGLTVGTPNSASVRVSEFSAAFCGYGVEGDGKNKPFKCKPSSGFFGAPFLSNPVDCSELEPTWSIAIDSVEHAGALRELGVPDLSDPDWKTASFSDFPVTGCDASLLAEQFDPAISTKALQGGGPLQADQPTGLSVGLEFPQSNDPTDLSTDLEPTLPQAPPPKDITLELPAGLAISPSSADGLGACSDQASDPAGDQVHYDNTGPVTCPDSSTIGSALAKSPLVALYDPITDEVSGPQPILGKVFLLKPHPGDLVKGQDSKFRLLVELQNTRYGINFKLPGVATADEETGQITTLFTENPQLPSSRLTVDLKSGPRAPLMTPITCGKFGSTSTLVPWSTPGTPDAHPTAGFDVGSGPNGSACVSSPGQRPFSPALAAGTDTSRAGAASPFVLRLTRRDGEQELSSLEGTMPPGFTAKIAGVASCSDGAIAAASVRSGAAEQADPSCPGSSQVGTATAGVGPGTDPYYAQGKGYLAGPYKGAPLSFVFITPAVAGSFDLGNVVIRAAVYVDPATAQVTVRTDPLPQILNGIPLRLRSLTIHLDRPDFTRNPTSCEPKSVTGKATAGLGQSVSLSEPFQVGGCAGLPFEPTLALNLRGELGRNGNPALRAVLRAGSQEAGIAAATITLPAGQLLDLRHVRTLCGRQLPAESCPPTSRIGYVRVWSPLLGDSVDGPIYLRTPSNRLPDLLADLRGGGLHFVLHGQTGASGGRLRIRLPALPDVPVSKAIIAFTGGRHGVVVNSEGLCDRTRRVRVSLEAHNGDQGQLTPRLRLRGRC
jgi:hypothetical protein